MADGERRPLLSGAVLDSQHRSPPPGYGMNGGGPGEALPGHSVPCEGRQWPNTGPGCVLSRAQTACGFFFFVAGSIVPRVYGLNVTVAAGDFGESPRWTVCLD